MVVLVTSRGWPRVVTSNMLRPAPRSRLENLIGFFSSLAGLEEAGAGVATAADMTWRSYCFEGALTKGRGCFVAGGKRSGEYVCCFYQRSCIVKTIGYKPKKMSARSQLGQKGGFCLLVGASFFVRASFLGSEICTCYRRGPPNALLDRNSPGDWKLTT